MKISPYIDEHGAITQHKDQGGDEGDSAFFCGHQALLSQIDPLARLNLPDGSLYKVPVELFFPFKDGRLCRHRKASRPWIREMDRGSRDQYTPWICLFALRSKDRVKPALKDIAKLLLRRFGFFTNTKKNGVLSTPDKLPDFITPEVLSVLLRGLLGKAGYPIYFVLDMWLVMDALYTRYLKDDDDIANYLAVLLTSNLICPTILSKLALSLSSPHHVTSRLANYFTSVSNPAKRRQWQNPWFIGAHYALVIDKVIDDTL